MGDFEHPLGGYDGKAMAEAIDTLQGEMASLIIKVAELDQAIQSMILIQSPNFGGYRPKNWSQGD